MRYFLLVWAELCRKKVSVVLTVLAVFTAFFLFGMLQGVNLGLDAMIDKFGDTQRLRVVNRVNRSEPLPLAHLGKIATLPGVESVSPVAAIIGSYQHRANLVMGVAVDAAAYPRIYPEFVVSPENLQALLRTRSGALVGEVLARRYGWKVGDRIPLQSLNLFNAATGRNWEFTVVGTYDVASGHDYAAYLLLNFAYLNEARASDRNTVAEFAVRLTDPQAYARVAPAIDDLFANSPHQTLTQNEKEFVQSTLSQIGDIRLIVNAIVGAVLFTLLFMTANTMMRSLRERVPEIGVLKALGYSDGTILALVLVEALLVVLSGALMGLLAASWIFPALMRGLGPALGLEGMRVPTDVFAWGFFAAAALAIASGLPPAWRANRLKVVEALARR
jgi:putative ABC transport system permease protein